MLFYSELLLFHLALALVVPSVDGIRSWFFELIAKQHKHAIGTGEKRI